MGQVEGHDVLRPSQQAPLTGKPGADGPRLARRRGEGKGRKKEKLPKTSLRHGAPVPAVLRRVRGGASVPVHRQSGEYSVASQRQGSQCKTVEKTGDSPGAFLGSVGTRPSLCNNRCFGLGQWPKNCGGSAVAVGAVCSFFF